MTQNSEGEYSFGIFDASVTLRFAVGTTKRGFAGLNVRDGSGVIRANLYAEDDGEDSGFRAWDAAGQVRAKLGYLGGDPAAFGVRVPDTEGVAVWQAPYLRDSPSIPDALLNQIANSVDVVLISSRGCASGSGPRVCWSVCWRG